MGEYAVGFRQLGRDDVDEGDGGNANLDITMKKLFLTLLLGLCLMGRVWAGNNTSNLGLYKPNVGETGWGAAVNTKFDIIDTSLGNADEWDTAYNHSSNTSNPHNTTKGQVGLGNVDNTSTATEVNTSRLITKDPWVDVRAYGAIPDDKIDDTAAFVSASAAAGTSKILFIPVGNFTVNSTSGNYAFNVTTGIRGMGPNKSIIFNNGTGSALKINGQLYYERFEDFSVIGNNLSEDGIVFSSTGLIPTEVSSCFFSHVDSNYNGRHGLVHRAAWGTNYLDCKFQHNGGLGIWLNTVAGDSGTNNAIGFYDCEIRYNGGIGNASIDYTKGGLRIIGAANVYWIGGVVENNNAWGVMIENTTGYLPRVISFRNMYMEYNPIVTSNTTIGGNFLVSGDYARITVEDSWMQFGAPVGGTGYCFYIANGAAENSYFKESNNHVASEGAGTNTRSYGLKYDWTRTYTSIGLSAGTTAILSTQQAGTWAVTGFIHSKKSTDTTGGLYPFIAAYNTSAGGGALQAKVGLSIVGASATAPTLAWGGGYLNLTMPTDHTGYIELNIAGVEANPAPIFTLFTPPFVDDFERRSN